MRGNMQHFALFLCLIALLAGCAPKQKTTVVLVPDDEGRTGAIVINGGDTEIVIKKPFTATRLDSRTSPSEPEALAAEDVERTWGRAMAVQPKRAARFVLYFKMDSTELTQESEELMDDILAAAEERLATDISVVGHADRAGEEDYNMKLSTDRARVVAARLVDMGIGDAILHITSHGENDPLVPTEDGVPEPRNRRVEVVVR
jgi:outer membrane protein OmpA-like peptidoglycan-associated protein